MTDKYTTKRALTFSIVTILVCLTIIIGTTFAWFTAEKSSDKNVIQSGNLDISLEYTVDGTNWSTVSKDTQVFDSNDLWEPGFTKAVAFRISNTGSLSLKYDLSVFTIKETEGTNKNGNKFKLSDYLEVRAQTQEDNEIGKIFASLVLGNRENAIGKTDMALTEKAFGSSLASGQINAGAPAHLVLVSITMPTTVGDEANSTSEQIPSIEFGINLTATQHMSEEDSFGSDYDVGAQLGTFEVSSIDQFISALNKKGTFTVKLMSDINTSYTGGKSINGTDMPNFTQSGYGNLINVIEGQNVTIDLNEHNITITTAEDSGSIFFVNGGSLTINGNGKISSDEKLYSVWCSNGTVNINGGEWIKTNNNGRSIIYANSNGTINVLFGNFVYGEYPENDGTVWENHNGFNIPNGATTCSILLNEGVVISNVEIAGKISYAQWNDIPSVSLAQGCSLSDNGNGTSTVVKTHVVWTGETASDELAENTDAELKTVNINTAEQLAALAASVNAGNNYKGFTINLINDIDLGNIPWTPIGNSLYPIAFQGIFDGHGHNIYNLKVDINDGAGLFGYTQTSDIKNVNVINASLTTTHFAGAIAGNACASSIIDCNAHNITISCIDKNGEDGDKAGGIVGYISNEGYDSVVSGCNVHLTKITANRDAGIIIGAKADDVNFTHSYEQSNSVSASNYGSGANIGGKVGRIVK